MQNLHAIFIGSALVTTALVALVRTIVVVWRYGQELDRIRTEQGLVKRVVRRIWADRDELRGEVNRGHQRTADLLHKAGLTPKSVMLSQVTGEVTSDLCGEPGCDRVVAGDEFFCPQHGGRAS